MDAATLPADAVLAAFEATPAGLRGDAVRAQRAQYGANAVEQVGPSRHWRLLIRQFTHLFAILLWVGSGLAVLAGQVTMAIAIVAVIVLNGLFGFWQEFRAEQAVAAMRRLLPARASVVRDGHEQQVLAEEVVPHDLLIIREGDRIAADARLFESSDLRVDESCLTGEAHVVHKSHRPGGTDSDGGRRWPATIVYAGTTTLAGQGRALVIRTGMSTEFGRIAALTQRIEDAPTRLQLEIASVARRVALLSVAMGAGFFLIGHYLANLTLSEGAVFAIGIVLGNVPEGLLPTMTLALAMGVQRMARRQAIVKRLSSVETLGSCTVICTDKTGTLTRNEMTVRQLWLPAIGYVEVTGGGYRPHGRFTRADGEVDPAAMRTLQEMLRVGLLCNDAHLDVDERGELVIIGDPTEGALVVLAAKAGLHRGMELQRHPLVREVAFDSHRKRMSTIHHDDDGAVRVMVKGAPRELLSHCTGMDAAEHATVVAAIDAMAARGRRVLGLAERRIEANEDHFQLDTAAPGDVERQLRFLGLVGMEDPPRDEVPDAIAACRVAGITIIMITGDDGLTAEAIARQIGLVGEHPVVVPGTALGAMSDDQLDTVLDSPELIFSRATPEDKLRIVTRLQARGETVAVTGDGVNDAPALKKADIGAAMGRSGTDVARAAADMILLDDNFATIVAAVEEGRAIFDNMRKFIVYIFAHLSPEAIPFILFALLHTPLPLTVMQILAIDLGTETLPALALGMEHPEADVMSRPPRPRNERLLSAGTLLRGYGFLGMMTTVLVLCGFFALILDARWRIDATSVPSTVAAEASTVTFVGIVVMQIANAFACRTERQSAFTVGLTSNRLLLIGIAFEVMLALVIVYTGLGQAIFGTAAVPGWWWLICLLAIPPTFLAEEARKWVVRSRVRSRS